jgi:hypothetical protein
LEHFSKDQAFQILCEIRRVLRPDGICFLQMPNADSPWAYGTTAGDLTHEAVYSPHSIRQLARLAGFSSCDVRELGPPPGTVFRQIRRALWRGIRLVYGFVNIVETGSLGSSVFSRVMMVRLSGGATWAG